MYYGFFGKNLSNFVCPATSTGASTFQMNIEKLKEKWFRTFFEDSTKFKTPSDIKPPLLSGLSDDHDWYKAKIKATIKAMKNKAGSISPTEACNDFAILVICTLQLLCTYSRCPGFVWFSSYLVQKEGRQRSL